MVEQLDLDIKTNKISHAYFLECDNYEEALLEAKKFTECILEKKIENNPDCVFIETSEKSIKVDQIRDLQKNILVKPLSSSHKVYIIPQAEKLNVASQNCLLKILEEPPAYAVLILIAPSVYSVIGTVRSRVKNIKIKNSKEVFVRDEIRDILDNLKYKNRVEVLKYYDFFDKNKDDITTILHEMLIYCNKRILDSKNQLSGTSFCDTITFARYISIIDKTEKRIGENSNFAMTIDDMLLNMKG